MGERQRRKSGAAQGAQRARASERRRARVSARAAGGRKRAGGSAAAAAWAAAAAGGRARGQPRRATPRARARASTYSSSSSAPTTSCVRSTVAIARVGSGSRRSGQRGAGDGRSSAHLCICVTRAYSDQRLRSAWHADAEWSSALRGCRPGKPTGGSTSMRAHSLRSDARRARQRRQGAHFCAVREEDGLLSAVSVRSEPARQRCSKMRARAHAWRCAVGHRSTA